MVLPNNDEGTTVNLTLTEMNIPEKTNREYYERYRAGSYRDGYPKYRTSALPRKDTPCGKSRVHVSVKGEGIWDDMENRTSRPHTLWAPLIKAELEKRWGIEVKLRWSQKAGCSCPCSPAFFVTGGPTGLDIWATIEADAPQTADPAEAAFRRAQLQGDPTIAPLMGVTA